MVAVVKSRLKLLKTLKVPSKHGLYIYFLILAFGLTGCASDIPEEIKTAPQNSPTVSMARADSGRFSGDPVRWGGVIVNVKNKRDETWIEIVARDLDSSGRPTDGDFSPGRFIAALPEFLDPTVYAKDRQITVSGILDGAIDQLIGQHIYSYPKVRADSHVLWKPNPRNHGYNYGYPYPGYGYDPYFGPGYGSYMWGRPGPYRHYPHY